MHKFEYENMEFSKDGGLDELIALDRYAIQSFDNYKIGDTLVFTFFNKDKSIDEKRVGVIQNIEFVQQGQEEPDDIITVKDRLGELHKIKREATHKPLELKPSQLWERWAKGGASVESEENKQWVENELRWLFDGYRYSLGGRIQLMLGQEYVKEIGEKANLTAYNCFVLDVPRKFDTPVDQFLEVLRVAKQQIDIQRRGGGTGINISEISTVNGANKSKEFFNIIIPEEHLDYKELKQRISIGKFDNVLVNTSKNNRQSVTISIHDSTDGLYEALTEMVYIAYTTNAEQVNLDFSNVRHRGAIVRGVNGKSSGAVSWAELFVLVAGLLQQDKINNVEFAEIYSQVTHLIEQGGSRRGATMIINDAYNENAAFFIQRKKEAGYLTGANISVGISNSFMDKVKEQQAKGSSGYELTLWDMIIKYAWQSAEPGVVFLERYNKESNSYYYNPLVATNPCG